MHVEALTREGKILFPKLRRFKNFYLVGGTALALQIGHRISVDFDMFSQDELSDNLLQQIKRVFGSIITVTYRSSQQINLLVDGVKMTFFHYPYPVLTPTVLLSGVPTSSILEIAAMKAFAMGQRASNKDYVDWYFMLKEKLVSINQAVELARQKFGGEFNDRLFLGQLISLEDVVPQKIDFLRDEVNNTSIQKFLREEVKKYA